MLEIGHQINWSRAQHNYMFWLMVRWHGKLWQKDKDNPSQPPTMPMTIMPYNCRMPQVPQLKPHSLPNHPLTQMICPLPPKTSSTLASHFPQHIDWLEAPTNHNWHAGSSRYSITCHPAATPARGKETHGDLLTMWAPQSTTTAP